MHVAKQNCPLFLAFSIILFYDIRCLKFKVEIKDYRVQKILIKVFIFTSSQNTNEPQ
jgi:hypothetical protein